MNEIPTNETADRVILRTIEILNKLRPIHEEPSEDDTVFAELIAREWS